MAVLEHKPPNYFEVSHLEPVLFLAGPIQGARDWQAEAVTMANDIWIYSSTIHVFNPRWNAKPEEFVKKNQITWEKEHLKRASILGGLAFFLASETADAPAPNKPGRAYAQTTRQEFGRAAGWKDYDPSVVVSLGMEEGYLGNEDYYRHTAEEFDLKVHDNLEDTITEVIVNIQETYRMVIDG